MSTEFEASIDPLDSTKVIIIATSPGDQDDTTAVVVRGTGVEVPSTADETPGVTTRDGEGGVNWSLPVEDGVNGDDGSTGVRGSGRFSASITLDQVSLLTLTTEGSSGDTLTATLNGTAIPYIIVAVDDNLSKQATKLAEQINNSSSYVSSSDGAVIRITRTLTGPVTFTTEFRSETSGGETGNTTGEYTFDSSTPLVGSLAFNINAFASIVTALGTGFIPVAGDVVTITYTTTDGTVVTRIALHDGTGTDDDDWSSFAYQIDGSLLVEGTVVADTIRAESVISNIVQSNPFVAFEEGVSEGVGYQLDGTSGNAEFNNVTIRGNSTVESTSISGTGIWGVAQRIKSSMDAQSFADEQHILTILQQLDTPLNYTAADYGLLGDRRWSIDAVGSGATADIVLSIGTSSGGDTIPDAALFENVANTTGGFIVRFVQNARTSYFEGWTRNNNTGTATSDKFVTISNNTKLAGDDLIAGNGQNSAVVTFFNGLVTPNETEFTSYIARQDGELVLTPNMTIDWTRVAQTAGTPGTMTLSGFELALTFEIIQDENDTLAPPIITRATPELVITETGAGVRSIAFTDLIPTNAAACSIRGGTFTIDTVQPTDEATCTTRGGTFSGGVCTGAGVCTDSRPLDDFVRFGTGARLEFQPGGFGDLPTGVEIGTIIRAQLRFTATGPTGDTNFRGLSTFFNTRDVSLAGGSPSLFTTLPLDTTDTVASIGSDDINKFSLTVAGGRGMRVIYDRVFSGRAKAVNGIDLGKAGFIMVRWDNLTPNDTTPNTAIYPFQNAFFTNAGDQLIKSDTNQNEEYFFGDAGDTDVETSAIKLVDITDNAGNEKGTLWIKVTRSGLATELILDAVQVLIPGQTDAQGNPLMGDIEVDIIGVFITSWNFGTIRPIVKI